HTFTCRFSSWLPLLFGLRGTLARIGLGALIASHIRIACISFPLARISKAGQRKAQHRHPSCCHQLSHNSHFSLFLGYCTKIITSGAWLSSDACSAVPLSSSLA